MGPRGSGTGRDRGYGQGRGSGRRRDEGVRRKNASGICYDFIEGTCKREHCRFLHKIDAVSDVSQRRVRVEETQEQRQARTQYISWKRYLGQAYSPSDNYTMERVWQGAVDILGEDDRDWKQQLPRDLDKDEDRCNGRAHVKALLERRAKSTDMAEFVEVSGNFLEVVTHSSLVDCLAVDEYVSGIYNFIGGGNGTRAIKFFQHLCRTLLIVHTNGGTSVSRDVSEKAIIRLAAALYELLCRNRRARLHDDLDQLLDTLDSAAVIIPAGQPSVTTTIVKRHLADTRALIDRAKGLIVDEESVEDVPRTFTASSYPRDIVIPANRHDNDKLDISQIAMFPTRDELMSDAKEFLPSTDPDQPHFLTNKVDRHFDTNFRLYRHDIFGELKKALSGLLHAATGDPAILSRPKGHLGDIRAYHYSNAQITYVSFDVRRGLQAQISFPQPTGSRHRTADQRRAWWEESRRLEQGSLLSYLFVQGSVVQYLFFTVTQRNTDPAQEYGLADNDFRATTTAKLTTQNHAALETLVGASCGNVQGVLLEFPNVLPATFVPVLENLQDMRRLGRLRFSQWLLPDQHDGPPHERVFQDIPPPVYARKTDFKFPLASILKAEAGVVDGTFDITATASCSDAALIARIASQTVLDDGQCRALVAALTREFAFIQGPPGTGKSYIGLQVMSILLVIKEKADLGPIIVVCYTNHALDQFLEHLINVGIEKIIRVGGQSRSDLLAGHNLRDIAKSEGKTKTEAYQSAMMYKKLEEHEEEVNKTLGRLHASSKHADWKGLSHHISRKYPKIYAQFQRTDADGFTIAGRHPFDIWKPAKLPAGGQVRVAPTNMTQIIGQASFGVYSLDTSERHALMCQWLAEIRLDALAELSELVNDADECYTTLNKVHDEADRRVLAGADVIGVTTSGLAKRISVLKHVSSKVIICEEAGEVMEPHMLSALLPTVEHCIQIGDHEQLRPTINNFQDLSLESKQGALHSLDKSQFERLSIGERGRPLMPVAQLEVQRRMRPDVSSLIRETIYPKLIDHPSITTLPDVVGMRKNVYWLDHDRLEDSKESLVQHSKSKSNGWEIAMVHALVRHIVRQGVYSSNEIAVLTPYTGQLQKLRTALRNDFEVVLSDREEEALEKDGFGSTDTNTTVHPSATSKNYRRKPLEKKQLSELLRVATVDNFQGEEAKIIVVSLVRSNKERNVGFLKTSNRINVLLSRAQHGMYMIGNVDTYSSVGMWQKVIGMLRAKDSVGQALALCCPRHVDKIIEIRELDDFDALSPEGGCREACADRLDCGHSCQARCHSDAMHTVWQCEEPCQRRHEPCEHPCQKATCSEDCGLCMIKIDNVQLLCGHTKDQVPCFQTLNRSGIRCDVLVHKEVPGCKHIVEIKCSIEVDHETFTCPSSCPEILPCGHGCPGSCGRCIKKDSTEQNQIEHVKCIKICGRKHGTCNHDCKQTCHGGGDCGLCQLPCEVQCKHSRCKQKCFESCAPCVEQCAWTCEHQGSCTMPCSAPCNRLPCDIRCTKLLDCGHQCPGLCGEECPTGICQQCGMRAEELPDLVMMLPYKDIDLSDTPIVVLGCKGRHFFTVETLDGIMQMEDVYDLDLTSGTYSGVKENDQLATSIPQCPTCREPVRQYATQRYNRLVNRAVIDEMSKRFVVSGQQELQQLVCELQSIEQSLEDTRPNLLNKAAQGWAKTISARYVKPSLLETKAQDFLQNMGDRHKPSHKLYEAIMHVKSNLGDMMANVSLDSTSPSKKPDRDQRITLGGRLYHLKVRHLILTDKFEVLRDFKPKSVSFPGGSPIDQSGSFLDDCKQLIKTCKDANSPKLAVEATLYYAQIARLLAASTPTVTASDVQYRETAKAVLEEAEEMCENAFHGRDKLKEGIEQSLRLLGREFYAEVTKEEVEAIKRAMVSGRAGIASHSGHWYNCENGHPFAIGECGMPMQLARCPECGAQVGGQSHRAVAGVTRAREMED